MIKFLLLLEYIVAESLFFCVFGHFVLWLSFIHPCSLMWIGLCYSVTQSHAPFLTEFLISQNTVFSHCEQQGHLSTTVQAPVLSLICLEECTFLGIGNFAAHDFLPHPENSSSLQNFHIFQGWKAKNFISRFG